MTLSFKFRIWIFEIEKLTNKTNLQVGTQLITIPQTNPKTKILSNSKALSLNA